MNSVFDKVVEHIYETYPETIQSDTTLGRRFEMMFPNIDILSVYSSITRSGRLLREKFPNKYVRSEKRKRFDKTMKEQVIAYVRSAKQPKNIFRRALDGINHQMGLPI